MARSPKTPVEFHLSDELHESALRISADHSLSIEELAIASVGMLNEARRNLFQTGKTQLIVDEHDVIPLPSLIRPTEPYPHQFSVALAPHLLNPMQEEYTPGRRGVDIQERARRAIRLGTFVLTYVVPYEDDVIEFRHKGKLVPIPFRTQQ